MQRAAGLFLLLAAACAAPDPAPEAAVTRIAVASCMEETEPSPMGAAPLRRDIAFAEIE